MISEVIVSDNVHKCCICGKPTQFIEINYQAPFCSDECIAEMDKQSGVKESEDNRPSCCVYHRKWFATCDTCEFS